MKMTATRFLWAVVTTYLLLIVVGSCLLSKTALAEPWGCWPTKHPYLPLCKTLGMFQRNFGGPYMCHTGCYDINQDGHTDLRDWSEFMNEVTEDSYTYSLASTGLGCIADGDDA